MNQSNNNAGIIRMDDSSESVAKIKVVGVGGAGGNAVNRMVRSGFGGVEFIAVNTDKLALDNSLADVKIPIGQTITKGLGAGAKPSRGYEAIQEDRASVEAAIDGADMVFITAGMGGGTGTGAAPVVAEIAREKGILSVAVVTRPFMFEGPVRMKNCKEGVSALRSMVDTIIVIQNNRILNIASKQTQVSEAFQMADDVLSNAVRGISDIILNHGGIQVDFADVKTVMEDGGNALMGTGIAEGEGRAMAAAERAIHSPLLDDINITGAAGVLVNITHGEDFSIHELNEVMSYIYESVGEENQPNIIFGHVESASMESRVSVTVIAAGFHKAKQQEESLEENTPSSNDSVAQTQPVAVNSAASPYANPVTQDVSIQATQRVQQNESYETPMYSSGEHVRSAQNPYISQEMNEHTQMHDIRNLDLSEVEITAPRPVVANPSTSNTQRIDNGYEHPHSMNTKATSSYHDMNSNHVDHDEIDYDAPAFLRGNW